MSGTDLVPIAEHPNLIPYKQGFDARRKAGRGRPTKLDDPEYVDLFACALSDGLSTPEMAALFQITDRTVRDHKRDPRVKAAALKYIEDRVIRVHRKVDAQIEQRLVNSHEIDTQTLLKIRKEFLGGVLRMQTEGGKDDEKTISEAQAAIEANPNFANELREFIEGSKAREAVNV